MTRLHRTHLWLPAPPWMRLPLLASSTLQGVEAKLGKLLPPSYLSALLEQNGGPLRYGAFSCSLPGGKQRTFYLDHIRGIGFSGGITHAPAFDPALAAYEELTVLAASDDGVVAMRHLSDSLMPDIVWANGEEVIELAPTFERFCDGLVRACEDYLIVLRTADRDELSTSDLPEQVLALFEELFDDLQEQSVPEEKAWILRHPTWQSASGAGSASMVLRPVCDDEERFGADGEFPEAPDATWVLELDMAPKSALWLLQNLRKDELMVSELVHTPPGVALTTV